MKTLIPFITIFCFLSVPLMAQDALIVKQDGGQVYLDISEFQEKPKVNNKFTITFWGGEIKNSKTGKILGKAIERRLNGTITEVEELFAIGTVKDFNTKDKLEGLNAKIEIPTQVEIAKKASDITQADNITPLWQSTPLEGKAIAFTVGNITDKNQNNLVLAYDDNNIVSYNLEDGKLIKTAEFKFNTINKIISLDNGDLNQNNRAEIFISYFDGVKEHFNTAVYEFENNNFIKKATINGLVKGIAPFNGKRTLYTQNINSVSGKFKPLTPAILEYKDGNYIAGESLKVYKFQSIYGFNIAKFDEGTEQVIYTQPNGKLRLQFDKKSSYINSPSGFNFASTPNRIKFDNEIFKFYSSIAIYNNEEGLIVAGLENNAKLGILSSTFGAYQSGKLVLLKWDGSSLTKLNETQLGGYTVDLTQGSFGEYQNVLIVPFITTMGKTTVALYPAK